MLQTTVLKFGEVELQVNDATPPLRSYWRYLLAASAVVAVASLALAAACCAIITRWNAAVGVGSYVVVLLAGWKLKPALPTKLWQHFGSEVERQSLAALVEMDREAPAESRIRVRGCAYDLAQLPVTRTYPFEPIVIRCLSQSIQTIASGGALAVFIVLSVLVMLALTKPVWLIGFVAVILLGLLVARLADQPTYLRVRPGRLEVIRYPVLFRGSPSVQEFDLRSRSVSINYGAHKMFIVIDTEVGSPLYLPRYCTWRPTELAAAVLQGAICDHPAHRVDSDALVG